MDVITIVTPSNVKKVESNHESADVKNNGDVVEPKTVRKNSFRLSRHLRIGILMMIVRVKDTTAGIEAVNQTNGIVGTRDNIVASQAEKNKEPEQEYILIPIYITDPLISQGPKGNTPVSTAEPSSINDAPSSPVNAAKTYEEHIFEQFSPFKNAFTLPDVPSVSPMDDNTWKFFALGPQEGDLSSRRSKLDRSNARGALQLTLERFRTLVDLPTGEEWPLEQDRTTSDILFSASMMHKRFQMSSIEELTSFLGLQVQQKDDGIFISQDKYVADILKKFDFVTMKTASTPIETNKALLKDEEAEDVDVHLYRSMIGSLMYLTASRPDIMFVVCACARFQVTPKVSHLHAVKRIFRYLKGQPKLGLWYPRDSPFDLEAFSDSDYAGASLDRKSTTGGCQFLGKRLISWQCKKQTIVANSTTEAEYVAAANCCGQVLWIQNQMLDYGFNFMNTKIYIDNESTICIVKNPVFHSKTKHIEIRHHFIRDSYEKRLIQVIKIHTDHNVADLLTKAFDVSSIRDKFRNKTGSCKSRIDGRTCNIKQKCVKSQTPRQAKRGRDTKIPQSGGPPEKVGDEAVHKELGDRMERAATTASSLEAEQDSGFHQIVDFLNSTHIKYALTENPTIYVSLIHQFWQTASASTSKNEEMGITATIDRRVKTVTEVSIRRHLKLEDSDGISTLPNTENFKQLALMGSPPHTNVADEAASTGVDVRHGVAATTLKKLEKIVKISQARRRSRVVISDDEEELEDPSKQGMSMIEEIDQDIGITLVQINVEDQVTPTKVSAQGEAHTQQDQPKDHMRVLSVANVLEDAARKRKEVLNVQSYTRRRREVSDEISTAQEPVSTAGASMPVSTAETTENRLAMKGLRGKRLMEEQSAEEEKELSEEELQKLMMIVLVQEEGQSVSSYVLKMMGYIDNLERLGHPVTLNLGVSLILILLRKELDSFMQNYNMHSMGKTINELYAMLKLHEQTLPKNNALALHVIRVGKVQKGNNKHKKQQPQLAARGQNQRTGKNKLAYAPKPKIPHQPKREDPVKDSICHERGKTGHWKRNCPMYLAELPKKKKLSLGASNSGIYTIELNTFLNRSWIYDTGCGTHICNTTQGLRASRKLKPRAFSLYVGNGQREAVEAIGRSNFCFPFVHGFVNCFANNTIQVSRNNMVYFSAIPRDGIFEIDLSNSYANDSSMYALSNKRAKLDLDSALLWHCRLGHISKKRIEKLQHDRLLNSTDLRAFKKCVSCMSGKMGRKSYTHQVERAKDLLGLIHTNVCGPFKTMSRQGASYFITFTDDFSRYGYVYLLKHKHEVFETFKVFQKEVENQLGKTIKLLRSDRGGEYMSQEFLDHLKDHGIIAHRTPPYTSQHNGVSERRNRTLLDMVRSMMSQTTLPKSFWDYALETAARILNMVPTKKVEKTPYEVWHGQAPKLSYLKF
ncbi:retrotransposon protein, putative, ty1-copia subclass [Tanacetum coccineum]